MTLSDMSFALGAKLNSPSKVGATEFRHRHAAQGTAPKKSHEERYANISGSCELSHTRPRYA
jgi:hypothetical protein